MLQEQKVEFRNKGKIKILQILKHREKQRNQARKINYVLQKGKKSGITSILIPARNAYLEDEHIDIYHIPTMWKRIKAYNGKDIKNWIRIIDRSIMEKLLLEWQQFHFRQANETPFASKEWEGRLGNSKVQEEILKGEFRLHEKYPPECQLLFTHMKREEKIKSDVNCTTTFEKFHSFIGKAKESTSASPSGRTYSHHKALAYYYHHFNYER